MTPDQETALAELAAALTHWRRVEARTTRALTGNLDDVLTLAADLLAGEPPTDPDAAPAAGERQGVTWETVHAEATAQLRRTLARISALDNGDEEYRAAVRAIIAPALSEPE